MTTAQDRIADACAHLNDVGLPNVQALVQSVRELRAYIRAAFLTACCIVYSDD